MNFPRDWIYKNITLSDLYIQMMAQSDNLLTLIITIYFDMHSTNS